MERLGEEFARLRMFHDAACIHDIYDVTAFRDHGQIVGNENDGQSKCFLALFQEIKDLLLNGDIEGC